MGYEINLIEGERGKLHVTSDDARTKNALMFGTGRKVFNMDHAFEATMPDSNTVRITSGVFYDNGMFIRIDRDRYVEVPVDNGLPGTYRNDLVCIRYERNIQTQLESAGIVVKKGEASETKAVDPAYSVGDVLDLEVHLDEFPLYRVALDGITPKLEPMFAVEDVMSNIVIYEELKEHLADDTPGYKHIPSGGSDGQILKWSSDGTAKWSDNILIDSEINNTSTNPVQNKVVKAEFDKVKSDLNGKANSSHTHTKSEVGLGNVDNTADANKNVKYATSAGSAPANGGNSATVNGHTVKSDVPANAKFTDTTYNDATTTSSGLMSASDKTTIENLKNGAVTGIKGNAEKEYRTGNVNITAEDIGMNVDSELSSTSTNPVQNKVVAAALDGKMPVYSHNGGTFDADDLTSPAIHLISSGGTNLPASCSGGVLLVDGSPQTTQYFFPLYNGDNRIHTRYKYHGTKWMDWEILGLSTSQSTAITTAGTYALDAVQNNASVSGTLANRIKAVEDTVGKVYSKTETVYGSGAWKMSGGLTVPAGTYIITRKGTNINGAGVSLGCGYNALSFVTTPADASTGIYTDIVTYTDSSNSIYIYYCAALNSTINLEIKAVRIK